MPSGAYQPLNGYPNNKLYQAEVYPVQLNATFTVAATNGLGISSLTGGGIANVFMHTSTTPATGNYGKVNPNPAAGLILIQLSNNFNKFLQMHASAQAPVTGSALTSVTSGSVYQIVTVGTTTAAQFQAKGLPVGVTPAVGQTFVASATGALGGTGTVKIMGKSGIASIEVAGDPSGLLRNANVYQNGGSQIVLQCLAPTDASTTTPILTNPADGTVMRVTLLLSNSSVLVNGQ